MGFRKDPVSGFNSTPAWGSAIERSIVPKGSNRSADENEINSFYKRNSRDTIVGARQNSAPAFGYIPDGNGSIGRASLNTAGATLTMKADTGPEPSSAMLLGTCGVFLVLKRRRA